MRMIFTVILLMFLLCGCAGSSQYTKAEKRVGNLLKFSLDVVSLGLLLSGQGSPAHIPAASLETILDFGKAVDAVASSVSSGDAINTNPVTEEGICNRIKF